MLFQKVVRGAFVLETDVTIKQGNAATLMFGATTFDATNIGRGNGQYLLWPGIYTEYSGKTVAIKLFKDGYRRLWGNNIIKGGTIAATDVDAREADSSSPRGDGRKKN